MVGFVYRNPASPAVLFDELQVDMYAMYTDLHTYVCASSSVHTCMRETMHACVYKYV